MSVPLKALVTLSVGTFVFLSACSDSSAPRNTNALEARQTRPVALASKLRTMDDDFEDLVVRVPGFGGLFYDEGGRLHVFMKNPEIRGQVTAALATFLSQGRSSRLAAKQREVSNMVVQQAKFDYRDLAGGYRRLAAVFDTRGLISTDIDEANNRITLGVIDAPRRRSYRPELRNSVYPTGLFLSSKPSPYSLFGPRC